MRGRSSERTLTASSDDRFRQSKKPRLWHSPRPLVLYDPPREVSGRVHGFRECELTDIGCRGARGYR